MTTTAGVKSKKDRRGHRAGNAVKGARFWRSSWPLTAFPASTIVPGWKRSAPQLSFQP